MQSRVQIFCQSSHVSALFSSQSALRRITTHPPPPPATADSTTWAHRQGNQTTTGQQVRYARFWNVGTTSLLFRTTVEGRSAVASPRRSCTYGSRALYKFCGTEVLLWRMMNYDLKSHSSSSSDGRVNTISEVELIWLLPTISRYSDEIGRQYYNSVGVVHHWVIVKCGFTPCFIYVRSKIRNT